MRTILVRLGGAPNVAYPEHITQAEHLGLLYLGASLKKAGFAVEILDANIEDLALDTVIKRMMITPPNILGISIMDYSEVGPAINLAHEVKGSLGSDVKIIAGGHAATYAYASILTSGVVDCVVMHEGEATIVDLLRKMEGGGDWTDTAGIAYLRNNEVRVRKGGRRPDLDQIPFPLRDSLSLLMRKKKHIVSIITSRGCDKKCIFCTNGDFFGPWRPRSPESVVDELEHLHKIYGAKRVDFQDANFIGPGQEGRERALEIANRLLSRRIVLEFRISCTADQVQPLLFRKLREAGLIGVNIGIESGSQAVLDFLNKGTTVDQNINALEILHELGLMIQSTIGFIMFRPGSTLIEIQKNLEFLRKYVIYISPKCLTNKLHITTCKNGYATIAKTTEPTLDVEIARIGFNIVGSHFLREYYSIFDLDIPAQSVLLREWGSLVLNIADSFVLQIAKTDLSIIQNIKNLLEDVNKTSASFRKEFEFLRQSYVR